MPSTEPERNNLAALLSLEAEGPDTFVSRVNQANGHGAIFGGQFVGQCLMAAGMGVPPRMNASSHQVHFLAGGQFDGRISYEVETLMEGRSFVVRQVKGRQQGRLLVNATTSFHRSESGPEHQVEVGPDVPEPESLPHLSTVLQHNTQGKAALSRMAAFRTLDLRPLDAQAFLFQRDESARFSYWVRVVTPLPQDGRVQQAALGYLSDYWFPLTAWLPHHADKLGGGLRAVSLNHTVWFHRPSRADEWLLVEAQCPSTGGARGITLGRVFDRDGKLVASLAQEGLYRGLSGHDTRAAAES